MRKQNLRKVKWCVQRNRAYVLRDGVRYWAPEATAVSKGIGVYVFNPNATSVTVRQPRGSSKRGGRTQLFRAMADNHFVPRSMEPTMDTSLATAIATRLTTASYTRVSLLNRSCRPLVNKNRWLAVLRLCGVLPRLP